jgi:mRNA-degrading endonuclease toxin of MazEF toxin-antitoxin module
VVTVVPVTSNVSRVYAFQVRLPARERGLRTEPKAQAEQVRAQSVGQAARSAGALGEQSTLGVDLTPIGLTQSVGSGGDSGC